MSWGNREKRIIIEELYDKENDRIREESLFPETLLFNEPRPRIDGNERNLTLLLTTECNAGCAYCYANTGGKKIMTFGIAKEAIDNIFLDFDGSVGVVLFGVGEPTTELKLIDEVEKYLKSEYEGRYKIDLMTNGVFAESAYPIIEKMDSVCFSCDGPEDIQNKMRPLKGGQESSGIVEKNIRYFIKKMPVIIRTVVTNDSVGRQKEIIKYFCSLGIEKMSIVPFFETEKTEKNSLVDISEEEFVDNFLEAREYGEEIGVRVYSEYLPITPKASFCGFEQPMRVVTPGGFLSSCWEWCEMGIGKEFIYGKGDKVFKDIADKIRERDPNKLQECNKCFLRHTCAGWCAARHYEKTGDLMKLDGKKCALLRESVKKHMLQIAKKYKDEYKTETF